MKREYDEETRAHIEAALRWAIDHPNHDFHSFDTDLRHANGEIYAYLCKIASSLGVR